VGSVTVTIGVVTVAVVTVGAATVTVATGVVTAIVTAGIDTVGTETVGSGSVGGSRERGAVVVEAGTDTTVAPPVELWVDAGAAITPIEAAGIALTLETLPVAKRR
jgi:hypothetical protein